MVRTFVQGKIHRIKVTDLKPHYNGSCLISPDLLEAAGIAPFERVELYSLTNTTRIATYVFPGAEKGQFSVNGGAALHFELGEEIVIVAYRQEAEFSGANCVIVDPAENTIKEIMRYESPQL